MKLRHILGNTYCIEIKHSLIPIYKINEKEIIMLDSGTRDENILTFLEENNFLVKAIICSHSHVDHIGNNIPIVEKYGALVAMHETEAVICESIYNLRLLFIRSSINFTGKHYGAMISPTHIKIKEGEKEVTLFGSTFGLIPLYGHSPYHFGIVTPDNVCYLGDAVFGEYYIKNDKLTFIQDVSMYLKTHQLVYNLNHDKYVLAHNSVHDTIYDLAKANEDFVYKKVDDITNLLVEPLDAEELVRRFVVKSKISTKENVFKMYRIDRMLRLYLDYLLDTGRAESFYENNGIKYRKMN